MTSKLYQKGYDLSVGSAANDPEDRQLVADALMAAVASTKLSQAAFAEALGTSQPRLSTYLTGRVTPAATLLVRAQRISAAFLKMQRLHLMSGIDTAAAFGAR